MSDIVITGLQTEPAEPNQGCVMQHVVRDLMGDHTSFHPYRHPCINYEVTNAAVSTNDTLPPQDRQRLEPFVDRILACRTAADPEVEERINAKLRPLVESKTFGVGTTWEWLAFLDKVIDTWEKIAADEGALGNPAPLDHWNRRYIRAGNG